MRAFLCLALLASPAMAETSLEIAATTPEATPVAQALTAELAAALAPGGTRADCLLKLAVPGDTKLNISHDAGPPAGWSLSVGPEGAPVLASSGPDEDLSAAVTAILDHFCPKQGDAAYRGPWQATGGGAQITITGTVADLTKGFTLEGSFPGGTAVFDYAPVSSGGGAVTYTISGSGVSGYGEGLYTLTAMPADVYTIDQTTDGCIDGVPNSCRTNHDVITLTPGPGG